MSLLETFIGPEYRPTILGARLDKLHEPVYQLQCKAQKIQDNSNDFVQNVININAICFGPRRDNVLINLEHVITTNDEIFVFYYEDIHKKWTFVSQPNENYFIYKKNHTTEVKVIPNRLYIRGCYVDQEDNYWHLLGEFFNFIELWNEKVLCSPKQQMPNESKLFQINNSLKKSAQNTLKISIGKSFVVKGKKQYDLFINQYLSKHSSYVIKSLSGVRSIVVDEHDFVNWRSENISNLPVLFQEKAEGYDLRVHIINNQLYAKSAYEKNKVDYRYDSNFSKLIDVTKIDSELQAFCKQVSKEEKNQLLGLDFIKTVFGYVVLEANPSPGWSAYHPYNGFEDEPFITALLEVLKCDPV